MEFLFSCSTQYLTSEHSKLGRYRVEHLKRNSLSSHAYVLFSIKSPSIIIMVSARPNDQCQVRNICNAMPKLKAFQFQLSNIYQSYSSPFNQNRKLDLGITRLKEILWKGDETVMFITDCWLNSHAPLLCFLVSIAFLLNSMGSIKLCKSR